MSANASSCAFNGASMSRQCSKASSRISASDLDVIGGSTGQGHASARSWHRLMQRPIQAENYQLLSVGTAFAHHEFQSSRVSPSAALALAARLLTWKEIRGPEMPTLIIMVLSSVRVSFGTCESPNTRRLSSRKLFGISGVTTLC